MFKYIALGMIFYISFFIAYTTTYPAIDGLFDLANGTDGSFSDNNATTDSHYAQTVGDIKRMYDALPYIMAGLTGLLVLIASQITSHEAGFY